MTLLSSEKFPAFSYRDFRLWWFGQLISNTGSQMQVVALNWHIYLLTHSAFALGLIGLARFVPIVLFSLLAGNFADVHNRKKIMLYTQTILTVLSILLALLTFTNTVSPILIYTLTIGSAIALSFDLPVRQALIPSLVERKDLPNALSLNSIMFQTSTIAGPALGGFIIAKFGVGSVYGINAISYSAVIFALILIAVSGNVEGQSTVSLAAMKEGIHFVLSKTLLWSTMILDFFATFFSSATALLPIFAKDILQVGPQGLGILFAAPSIGAVLAAFTFTHMGIVKKQGKVLVTAVIFYGIGTILFGVSKSFWFSVFSLMVVGAGDNISTIIRNTARQLATPDYIRGRMTSVNMIFFLGGPQLGEFEAGVLAASVGGPLSVVIGGVGTIIAVGIMAFTLPVLRNYEIEEHKH